MADTQIFTSPLLTVVVRPQPELRVAFRVIGSPLDVLLSRGEAVVLAQALLRATTPPVLGWFLSLDPGQ